VEETREGGPAKPDGTLEWLQQLERRVLELERIAAKQERLRRRSFVLMLVAGVLYVLVVYWEMSRSVL